MRYVSSLTDILRATLKRMERDAQFRADERHARELRSRLLIAIADAEERNRGHEDGGSRDGALKGHSFNRAVKKATEGAL